jgi:two-component system cell cycle sensor histidine kinase/response regulator CckA
MVARTWQWPSADSAITVLFVEPRACTAAAARELLEDVGFEVLSASNGLEARRAYRDSGKRVDVLVTELRLPDGDACQLVRELRRTSPDLKVIFVSVYAADEPEVRCALGEPDSTYVEKGLEIEQLTRAIRALASAPPSRAITAPEP